jgi:hypothetical protein
MMRLRFLAAVIASPMIVAGCGQSSASRNLALDGVPLTGGARVVARAHSCDRGAHPYCALQLVVVGPGFHSSMDLLTSEESRLRGLGWTSTVGDTPKERSSDSPGHRLRLSLGLASDDLLSWDQGQIKRRPGIARALARTMFQRAPALSLMLETGSS